MKATQDERNYLGEHGWVEDTAFSEQMTPWRWRQPKTGARFRLQDALDAQRGMDKEPNERRRPAKGISPSVPEKTGDVE